MSLAVRALEQRLGVALIDRSARKAEPTPEGRAVIARAQRILALERDMVRAAQEEADVLRGPARDRRLDRPRRARSCRDC